MPKIHPGTLIGRQVTFLDKTRATILEVLALPGGRVQYFVKPDAVWPNNGKERKPFWVPASLVEFWGMTEQAKYEVPSYSGEPDNENS